MHLMSADLGVSCEYCHVEGDFASDTVPKKNAARKMIEMTNGINRTSFGGARVITCYSCHRGAAVPPNTPMLPFPQTQPARSVSAPLPSVDEILAKYIAAIGGEKARLGVRSRVITATQDIPTGPGGTVAVAATIEEYRKAPGKVLNVAKTSGAVYTSGFDGDRAWIKDARGRVSSPAILDQVRAKLGADFYEPLDIAREYARLKVAGTEKVGPKDAFVIVGYPLENVAVRFYFDTESGLLVRRYTSTPTEAGDSPYQEDYSDYRLSHGGVKYPYRIDRTPAGTGTELLTHSTILIQDIGENVEIEDAKFQQPGSAGSR